MPKKKVISMLEFLRTGSFGGVSCGVDVSKAKKFLGKPIYVKEYDNNTEKWVYEAVDFCVNLELKVVYAIIIWGFQDEDEQGNRPREDKRFQIDPWELRWQTGLDKTIQALESENLNFRYYLKTPRKGYESIQLESGSEIVFDRDFDVIDGRNVYPDPPRLVYDAILNINLKYAVTTLNPHLING